jgi:hypothetical protein
MSRIKVDRITDRAGTGEPLFPNGVKVVGLTSLSSVVAGIATFENVSIGGTLTYEDVTNIDSTGIVTAKSGIKIGSPLATGIGASLDSTGNAQFSGIVTASSFVGDINASSLASGTIPDARLPNPLPAISGANLTNLPPAGNTISLVADGAIAAGKPCVIQTDGKTKQLGVVMTNPGSAPQNSTEGTGGDTAYYGLCWSPQRNRAILAQAKESGNKQGSAFVMTPALPFGTNSLTGGTDQPFDTSDIYWTDCAYDPDTNQTIFVYRDDGDSGYGKCVLGTLSGSGYDEMTYGSIAMFESNVNCKSSKVVYDTHNNKVIVVWSKGTGSGAMRAAVGTVSGTSITFGTVAEIGNSVITDPGGLDLVFDASANKAVCIYHDAGDQNRGYAAVLTVSGTDITWETPVKFAGNNTVGHRRGCFDANSNKLVVVYRDSTDSGYGKAVVGTVSGTTTTWGTPTAYPGNIQISGQAVCYDPSSKDIFIFGCMSNSSNHGRILRGTVSGNSITIPYATTLTGGQDPMHNDSNDWALVAMNTGNTAGEGAISKIVGVCRQVSNGSMKYYTFKTQSSTTNGTCSNIIGWSAASYTDGQTATLNTVGNVIDNQSGLTPGTDYYIHGDGTLATSWDSGSFGACATNANFGGTAIAADKLLIRDINAQY